MDSKCLEANVPWFECSKGGRMMPTILGIGDVHACSQFCSRDFRIVRCHLTGFLPASRCPFMLRLFLGGFSIATLPEGICFFHHIFCCFQWCFEVETFSTVKRTSTFLGSWSVKSWHMQGGKLRKVWNRQCLDSFARVDRGIYRSTQNL